jgi:hypothetical protein
MRRLTLLIVLAVAATPLTGCLAVRETQNDQDKMRTALNNLYENQIMDNLIRAANGLPFVQIDYTNATSTVSVTESGNVGGTQDLTTSRQRNLPSMARMITRIFTNHWSYGVSGMNSNQIALTANPVINNNEVYDAYLQFLANPGSLVVSCDPPPDGKAHVWRKWKGNYYWVPLEYRYLFLKLSLVTTSQRGKRLQPVDPFFTVTVIKLTNPIPGDEGTIFLTAKLDTTVPSDSGRIEFNVDGKRVVFTVDQVPSPVDRPAPETTDTIIIRFNPKAAGGVIHSVADFKSRLPLQGKLFLDNSRPQQPATGDLLEAVRFQLEQIRLNQIRLQ